MARGVRPVGAEAEIAERATAGERDPGRAFRPEDLGIGQLFWAIRDAVIVGDAATGCIALWSPAAERLFGYAAAEVVGRPMEILVPASLKARHRAGLARFAAAGSGPLVDAGAPVELPALRKGGDTITVELSLTPIERTEVPGCFVLAVVRDATERKRAEAERLALVREQAARAEAEEAVRARDRFLAVAAHELRTPVTTIKGYAQALRRAQERGGIGADQLARSVRALDAAAGRLAVLTDDLLDVSRLRLGQLALRREPLDLGALAREVVGRYRDRLGGAHRLTLAVGDGPCRVEADPARMEQVLDNLLANAVKYSPAGGDIRLALSADGGGVLLRVEDEGIGLPPGSEAAIFEPFGRADNAERHHLPGLGLGLHICRGIVERHGGRIQAESAGEGCGTTVSVWLPRRGEPERG